MFSCKGKLFKNLKLYKKRDLSYHSYRDFSEESLHKGIEEVTKRGGYVFLMSERGKVLLSIIIPL